MVGRAHPAARPGEARPSRRWPLRLVRGAAAAFAGLVLLVVALIAAALVAVNLPWGRRLAVRELDTALSTMFKGHIVVERVGSLGIYGAGGIDAHVTAPDGTVVLAAHGASARIAPFALVRSLLRRHGELQIRVFDVDVNSLEVNLDTDAAGVLKVQGAFDPAQPAPAAPSPPGRPLFLEFPSVTVKHGWAHGQMNGAPPIDADLDDLRASIRVPPDGLAIDVPHVQLLTRGMPQGADVHAAIEAHLAMSSNAGANLEARARSTATSVGSRRPPVPRSTETASRRSSTSPRSPPIAFAPSRRSCPCSGRPPRMSRRAVPSRLWR